mgnify:CR=1 FL=1
MTKTKEEATLSFKEQLLKDWNSVKDDTGGYHNPRKKIRRDIEEIRQRVLTDYENYWSYGDELKKEDKKKEDLIFLFSPGESSTDISAKLSPE